MEQYKVTGLLVNGRRFKAIYTTNYMHAMGINLWRGNVWVRKPFGGGWSKIKTVWN